MKNIAIIVTSLNGGGAERIAGLLSVELAKIYNRSEEHTSELQSH